MHGGILQLEVWDSTEKKIIISYIPNTCNTSLFCGLKKVSNFQIWETYILTNETLSAVEYPPGCNANGHYTAAHLDWMVVESVAHSHGHSCNSTKKYGEKERGRRRRREKEGKGKRERERGRDREEEEIEIKIFKIQSLYNIGWLWVWYKNILLKLWQYWTSGRRV